MSKFKYIVISRKDPSIFYIVDKVTKVFDKYVTERHIDNGVVASFIIPAEDHIEIITDNYMQYGDCAAYFPDGDPDCITAEGFVLGFCNTCEHFSYCPYH